MRGTSFDSAEFQETVRQQNAFFARERHQRSVTFPSRPAYPDQMQTRCDADDAYEDSLHGSSRWTIGYRWSRHRGGW
jgi:hypothetical protein